MPVTNMFVLSLWNQLQMVKGIRIAKNGGNVTSVNAEDLYVDSDTPIFKLYKSGSGSQRINGTLAETHTITIPHNLGYVPFFLVFMDRNPGSNRRLCSSSESTNAALPTDIACFIGNSNFANIVLTINSFGGTPTAGDYGYNYFIYYDRLSGAQDG